MIRTVIKYTDNKILLNDAEVFETSKNLFPGMYDIEYDEFGRFKNFLSLKKPKSFPLMPSTELDNIQDYITKFLSVEHKELCKKANILVKGGILLYGEPGIGKSNYTNYLICKAIEERGACVFNIDSYTKLVTVVGKVKELREIQNNLFVVVLEEIDELLKPSYPTEAVLKNFMDGINSVDNLLFVSSTNYLDNIPESLTKRPSRFKKVLEIKAVDDVDKMKVWLKETYRGFIADLSDEDCERLHDKCLNKTIDEIKHILIDYKMDITSIPIGGRKKLGFKKD